MISPPSPRPSPSRGGRGGARGFTLLEVLVALTILAVAIVALMQLSSQGLRLLHRADDYQQAIVVADRVARAAEVVEEGAQTGQEGRFQWERRVSLVPVLLRSGAPWVANLGTALVQLEGPTVTEGDGVTHLSYHVRR